MPKRNSVRFLKTETLIKRACVHAIFFCLCEYLYWEHSSNSGTIITIYWYLWICIRRKKLDMARTRRFTFLWKRPEILPQISVNTKALCIPFLIKKNGPFKIKTTMSYHFTSVRMAVIKKSTNSKCCGGCGEKGTLLHCWWESKLLQPLWGTVWRFHEKLKIELPHDQAIPLLGVNSEKNMVWKDTWTPVFTAALFTRAKTWKKHKRSSTEEWVREMWDTYTTEYYSVIK